jgi:hypothetical protein
MSIVGLKQPLVVRNEALALVRSFARCSAAAGDFRTADVLFDLAVAVSQISFRSPRRIFPRTKPVGQIHAEAVALARRAYSMSAARGDAEQADVLDDLARAVAALSIWERADGCGGVDA